jgi:hypothetical protein
LIASVERAALEIPDFTERRDCYDPSVAPYETNPLSLFGNIPIYSKVKRAVFVSFTTAATNLTTIILRACSPMHMKFCATVRCARKFGVRVLTTLCGEFVNDT